MNLSSRLYIAWGGVFVFLGVIGILFLIYSPQKTLVAHVGGNMDPPPPNGSSLSQEDVAAIRSGLEKRQHDGFPSQVTYYNSEWLNPYRYRDGQGLFYDGTANFNPVGASLDPPCPYIIWLKGNYGLYFYDARMPDVDLREAHSDVSHYVELRKLSADNKTKSQVIFVVPMPTTDSQ